MTAIKLRKQDQKRVLKQLGHVTVASLKVRARLGATLHRRKTAEYAYLRQIDECEDDVCRALVPMFERQIKDAARRLSDLGIKSTKKVRHSDTASFLAQQVFDPNLWDQEMVNRVLPVMARQMAQSMFVQMRMSLQDLNVELSKSYYDRLSRTKASTAVQWLERQGIEDIEDVVFSTPYGDVSMGITREFPQWMKDKIQDRLNEIFVQDYWTHLNDTTLGDIEEFLRVGLRDGWSIDRMAREMAPELIEEGQYALKRGRTIARTESAYVLNSARNDAIDELISDVGDVVPMGKEWMSVLGNTTRDTHADLDGVPADKEGMWTLAGYRVRVPGDIVLPPGERCNCRCSILTSYGLTDSVRDVLIAEYEQRVSSHKGFNGRKDCGVGVPGSPGFQPGNTCGKEGGRSITAPDAPSEGLDKMYEAFKSFKNTDVERAAKREKVSLKNKDGRAIAMKAMVAERIGKRMEGKVTEEQLEAFLDWTGIRTKGKSLSEEVASQLVECWANSSGDGIGESVAIQDIVREKFGLEDTPSFNVDEDSRDTADILREELGDVLEAYVDSVYEETQDRLKELGIDSLTVYRGMHVPKGEEGVGNRQVRMQPISSFSTNYDEAYAFARSAEGKKVSALMAVEVPREKVFSTSISGLGCLREEEVVVLGGEVEAKMVVMPEKQMSVYRFDNERNFWRT